MQLAFDTRSNKLFGKINPKFSSPSETPAEESVYILALNCEEEENTNISMVARMYTCSHSRGLTSISPTNIMIRGTFHGKSFVHYDELFDFEGSEELGIILVKISSKIFNYIQCLGHISVPKKRNLVDITEDPSILMCENCHQTPTECEIYYYLDTNKTIRFGCDNCLFENEDFDMNYDTSKDTMLINYEALQQLCQPKKSPTTQIPRNSHATPKKQNPSTNPPPKMETKDLASLLKTLEIIELNPLFSKNEEATQKISTSQDSQPLFNRWFDTSYLRFAHKQ